MSISAVNGCSFFLPGLQYQSTWWVHIHAIQITDENYVQKRVFLNRAKEDVKNVDFPMSPQEKSPQTGVDFNEVNL